MRTFLAIDVGEESVRERMEEFGRRVAEVGGSVKPVRKENLHMTVKFFGELSRMEVEEIDERLRGLEHESVRIVYKGVGAFPSPSRPRVIWVGVNEGSRERLMPLIREVLGRLKGIRGDEKPFSPHVTVARVKGFGRRASLAKLLKEFEEFEFGEDVVKELKLKKSELTPRGPIYTDLYVYRLGG